MPDHIAKDAPGPGAGESERWPITQAGCAYGAAMLAATLLFAPLRRAMESLGIDPVIASLTQAVATLFALIAVAGWVVQGFDVPRRFGARLAIGGCALLVLAVGYSAWEILLFGETPQDFLRSFAGPHGAIFGTALLFCALMPAVRNTR